MIIQDNTLGLLASLDYLFYILTVSYTTLESPQFSLITDPGTFLTNGCYSLIYNKLSRPGTVATYWSRDPDIHQMKDDDRESLFLLHSAPTAVLLLIANVPNFYQN